MKTDHRILKRAVAASIAFAGMASLTAQARQLGATSGRIGQAEHDRATRDIRRQVLRFYESSGRSPPAARTAPDRPEETAR